MEQKVITIGNSIGITIPQPLRDGLQSGDKVKLVRKADKITITLPSATKDYGVDTKFAQMVDEFITEHKDVLEALAKR